MLRTLDCHRPLHGHLGEELGVIPEALLGAKRLAAPNAETLHGIGMAADFVPFHSIEDPVRIE